MTVDDLIAELKKHPGHWPVMIETIDHTAEQLFGPEYAHYPILEIQSKTGMEIHGMAAVHLIAEWEG